MALLAHSNDGRLVVSHGMDANHLRKANRYKCLRNMNRKLGQFFRMTTDGVRYAHNRNGRGRLVPSLITLTYPDNSVWQPDQITKFMNQLRNYSSRKWGINLRYAWVAESTKKGVIHYHVVVWQPRNKRFPKPDQSGWWPYGASQIAGVKKGVGKYLMKYLTKGSELGIDRENERGNKIHVRSYAVGGLEKKEAEFLSHYMLPEDIKSIFGPVPFGQKIRRVKGGWECGKVFVKGNWSLFRSIETGLWYLAGGMSWCELPDEPLKDIWIPF